MSHLAQLTDRAVLTIEGEDRVSFLQGLVSNDVADAAPGRAVFAALLSPQGKWQADFFILSDGERLFLDCEAAQAPGLQTKLTRFRLRSKAMVAPSALRVFVGWDGRPEVADAVAAPDPRLPEAGWRVLAGAVAATSGAEDWDAHRLRLGLPDGSRDIEADKAVLLEAGFDELHGVSWTKGCYMGQELTARTKYRGLLKRRLIPVGIEGLAPEPGTPVVLDGLEVGAMRSSRGAAGMALLRLRVLQAPFLRCGQAVLAPRIPAWMAVPESEAAD